MPRIRRWLPILLALVLLLLWFAWRQWQGPEIPAYQLEQRPLVQRVVASGEVDSQSLAVGADHCGQARHVRETCSTGRGSLIRARRGAAARLREASGVAAAGPSQRPQTENRPARGTGSIWPAVSRRREALVARQLLPANRASSPAGRDQCPLGIAAAQALRRQPPGGSDEQLLQQRRRRPRCWSPHPRPLMRYRCARWSGDVVQPARPQDRPGRPRSGAAG